MSIFNLHSEVIDDYRHFVRSFISVADERIRSFLDQALMEEQRLWPESLIQVSPSYERTATVDELARRGVLLEETAGIFRTPEGEPFHLYQHQVEALQKAKVPESYVVTSGTGSGKSLTYFLPIIDDLLRHPPTADRVAALVVYPMNALVNSQLQALEKLRESYERRTGVPFPVRFAKYTGETPEALRNQLRHRPPPILLTNYVMGELLLVRPDDQSFLDRAGGGLRFLVFDELHTYRGRQGADVAMLIRRIKERCAAPGLVCVGTSATMVANREVTSLERRSAVAEFASRLMGTSLSPDQIVEEMIETFTGGGAPSRDDLMAALSGHIPETLLEFRRNPLARWAEAEFGVEQDDEGRLRRRVPRTLSEAAERLAEETGSNAEHCESRLRELLIQGSRILREDGARAFAFKLHQFISQGRAIYATIEPAEHRELSLEGQIVGEGGVYSSRSNFAASAGRSTTTYWGAAREIAFALIPLGRSCWMKVHARDISCSLRPRTIGARTESPKNGAIKEAVLNPHGVIGFRSRSGLHPMGQGMNALMMGQRKCGFRPSSFRFAFHAENSTRPESENSQSSPRYQARLEAVRLQYWLPLFFEIRQETAEHVTNYSHSPTTARMPPFRLVTSTTSFMFRCCVAPSTRRSCGSVSSHSISWPMQRLVKQG